MSGLSGMPYVSDSRGTFLDISSITPLRISQLLNHYSTIHNPRSIENLKSEDVKPRYWHRFTIIKESGCQNYYSKIFLLKLITDFVYPHEILPVHVCEKDNKLLFLARNCKDAILKLCEANLILPNPLEPKCPFSVVIIKDIIKIQHIPVINIEPNIIAVLKKRESHGILDLSSFHDDEDLQEFCPLSQPKVLLFVLSLTSQLEKDGNDGMKITKIALCNNDIQKLPNLESMNNRQFTAIDLGHNKIQNIKDVVPLKDLPHLQWVRLEGNPLCCQFDCGLTYFLYMKTICKNLQTLDTKKLCEDGWYKKHRAFLCDSNGFDFANQFVEKYYTYFDQNERPNIAVFYDENAMFSFTHCSINKINYPEEHKSLNIFIYRERNLLITRTQHSKYLHFGREKIREQFIKVIPPVRHHHKSFFIDLMQYTKTFAVISITGVFKGIPQNFLDEDLLCGFTRTFALTSTDGREWLITNDQWHVYTPYKYKKSLPPWGGVKIPTNFPYPHSNNAEQQDALTRTFEKITGITYEYSKTNLVRYNWNLTRALDAFIDQHINNEIPDYAFSEERDDVEEVQKDDKDDEVTVSEDDMLPSIATLLTSEPTSLKATNTNTVVKM